MTKPPPLHQISREATQLVSETIDELKQAALTSEQHIRKGMRSSVRTVTASILFCVAALASIGSSVTNAVAHRASHSRVGHTKAKHHRHRRHWHPLAQIASEAHVGTLAQSETTGVASWYGRSFQHRRTASGRRFDTNQHMAAHRTLPFGTLVRVTNLDNHRTVVVEITDRGPFAKSRIIDLSHAAAVDLGFERLGTANVRLDVLTAEEALAENVQLQNSEPDDE